MSAAQIVRGDDRFAAQPSGVSQPGCRDHAEQRESVVAGRYYLHPAAHRVHLPGRGAGCVLPPRHRWALGRTLEAALAVSALTMALRQRRPTPGWVHHSDRGVQYASHEYTDMLKQNGARISMSRKGNPYDNAACESFMKTLKYEEVYRSEYRDLADAYARSASSWNASQSTTAAFGSGLCPACRVRAERREYSMTLLRDESFSSGAAPSPRDLSHSGQNDGARRQIARPPLISAPESALGLRPRSALSSAQVLPEWITSTSPCNDLSANGDNPLTRCLTPGVQFSLVFPPHLSHAE